MSKSQLDLLGAKAKEASRILRITSEEQKNKGLQAIADALIEYMDTILKANASDVARAKESGMSISMIDRLSLTKERIMAMSEAVIAVSHWPDPIGKELSSSHLKNGLTIKKVAVPLGVIGIIFEARPNVTSDCVALCIKAGNCVILRGGKEAFESNNTITDIMRSALRHANMPEDCVQLVQDTARQSATEMMELTEYLDVLIPRGGSGLIRSVVDHAKVPVIETGAGNCHIYVDKAADLNMAADIVINAKTSRPSVCNAAEKLLVHKDVAKDFLPLIAQRLTQADVTLRCDAKVLDIIDGEAADGDDWSREYSDLIMGLKIVDSVDEAIAHIEKYSTHHSECIVTEDKEVAEKFLAEVDSAAVYHNASTRFTDGGEMGLGAEIGISTQKLHARGPMGVDQLVSYKYVIEGDGQCR